MKAFRTLVFVAAACLAAAPCCGEPAAVDYVRPMIGTSAHGHTYPGATVPFGMVQLSPDTRLGTWDGCSGYHYSDGTILGFSHTHLSGTGCGDLGDIRITPLSGTLPKPEKDGYPQRFSHAEETARAGYYQVTLTDPRIEVELTATAHAGLHRYRFPAGAAAHLIFDLERGISNKPLEGSLTIESPTRVSGSRRSKGWAADKTFYFVAEFSRPFERGEIQADGKSLGASRSGKGVKTHARLDFPAAAEPVLVRLGLSGTSVAAAGKNLAAEIQSWDFSAVAAAAAKNWNDVLSVITIDGIDQATRETFYTALYHACTAPILYNNVDGSYQGLDHQPHAPAGFDNYSTFSLWDTFRTEHPLLTLIQPQRVSHFVRSMLAHYREFNHHSLPVWSLAGNETWCMIGNHAIPVIVEAYAKGFRDYDVEAVYQALCDSVSQDRDLMNDYRRLGYVPSANRNQSVARTLEYVYDDWCIGYMAQLLGKKADAQKYFQRAQNYRNVFDPAVGFMRGKTAEGKWRAPFDPRELAWADYTEATAWNYTWFVLHDVPGLVKLLGGDGPFVSKLDQMFSEDSTLLANIPDLTGLIGQYIHGNEPCHHVAYLYAYAGAAHKTQARIRQIMTSLYNNSVDGICGNDDCGQTSAWYALSALGFYPVSPASGVYVLGSPLVGRATLRLDAKHYGGRTFSVVAENNSPRNVYVQAARLNGQPLARTWFTHAELAAGGELRLTMGPQPNPAWGQRPQDRPPAVAPGK